ncbi:hypothetical protein EAI_12690 [Harpegnathos saltator]|uniref:Uncharacterized protein n=1 Tax=Harpegnathos saltator TaxID=610380 RepID=E2C4B6_HARSA|nr:hypothetical protein EAI_12690 [Harpegnathos saltator]
MLFRRWLVNFMHNFCILVSLRGGWFHLFGRKPQESGANKVPTKLHAAKLLILDSGLAIIRFRRVCSFKKQIQISNLTVIILLFLVVSLLITVVVLAVLYAFAGRMRICDNEDCVRVAASLKESMDTSVDPCDDFYQ